VDLAMLESSSVVAAIVVAQDGTILGANTRMRRFLGLSDTWPRDQRLGDHFVDEAAWASWCQATRRGSPMEAELRGPDGATKMFRGDVRRDGDGPQRRFVGIFVDGEESEALRVAAQHTARIEALGSLMAGVAHDFNDALTVLVRALSLIGEELREQPRALGLLKAARDAGKRGADLMKQLINFARREQLDLGTVDPVKVIGELLPLLRRALGSRITLETELQERVGTIRVSLAQLESVIVNLAINARDAIAGNGRIFIEVARIDISEQEAALRGLSRGGRYVTLRVRDAGLGVAPAALERGFEPFFSTRRERGGTGLGLSMVRWFAESCGGCASVDSVVGQGTTVTLLLPSQQAEPTAHARDKTLPIYS
jgi:signal transduction histidine kinase